MVILAYFDPCQRLLWLQLQYIVERHLVALKSMSEIGDSIHRVETLLRDLKELDDGAKVSTRSIMVSSSNLSIGIIVIITVMDSNNLSFLNYFSGAIF